MQSHLSLIRLLYSGLFYLATPFIIVRLLWRSRRNPAYRQRLTERFGLLPFAPTPGAIWIHAVSVGEVMVASTVIKALQEKYPEKIIFVTTTTPTGSAQLRALFPQGIEHSYLPYDQPLAIKRFLKQVKPILCVLMETEIWPNLIHYCHQQQVPMVIANARLSPRSCRGYGRIKFLIQPLLQKIEYIAAQSQQDAERFIALGAHSANVSVMGNLKYDIALPEQVIHDGPALRERLGATQPLWIAASTHEGEEAIVLEAHAQIKQVIPGARLILVPRHPERAEDIEKMCLNNSWNTIRYSQFTRQPTSCDILLGDTIGDLRMLLASADVAFIGGSLVPVGGHNLLEPAALSLPVLTGPHMFNFTGINAALHAAGAATTCHDATELADAVTALLKDKTMREQMGRAGKQLVANNQGSVDNLMSVVNPLLKNRLGGGG